VKVNVVVMNGMNDHELNDFVEWTRDVPVHVRFIEFMRSAETAGPAIRFSPGSR